MMVAISTSETSVSVYQLHDAKSQKTAAILRVSTPVRDTGSSFPPGPAAPDERPNMQWISTVVATGRH
jgi:hypothetical protein